MIYPETILKIGDNSGAKEVKCIKVIKSSKKSGAKPGGLAVVSIQKIKSVKNFKKGQVSKGVLIRGKKNIQRNNGFSIKFSDNCLIMIDQKNVPSSTRILGPIYRELREKDYPKLLTMAKVII